MVQGTGSELRRGPEKLAFAARVLQRRALLVSPAGPIRAARLRSRQALRIEACGGASGTQFGQLGLCSLRIGLVPTGGAPPVVLPEPGRDAARRHAKELLATRRARS